MFLYHGSNLEIKQPSLNIPAVLWIFETDDVLWDKLSIQQFEKADKDWLQTVVAYRKLQKTNHQYDVIAGPIANDRTVDVINQYIAGAYPEHIALELLLPMKFQDQWALESEKAIAAIT